MLRNYLRKYPLKKSGIYLALFRREIRDLPKTCQIFVFGPFLVIRSFFILRAVLVIFFDIGLFTGRRIVMDALFLLDRPIFRKWRSLFIFLKIESSFVSEIRKEKNGDFPSKHKVRRGLNESSRFFSSLSRSPAETIMV